MAKKRRLITRRRLKWAGTGASASVLAALVMTIWIYAVVIKAGKSGTWAFGLDAGSFDALHSRMLRDDSSYTVWRLERKTLPNMRLWFDYEYVEGLGATSPPLTQALSIPLWIPLLLIAVPTAWLWRIDRRAKPWQCAKCRYDLRGLTSESQTTTCPECGTSHKP